MKGGDSLAVKTAGLPNILGKIESGCCEGESTNGNSALYTDGTRGSGHNGGFTDFTLSFDASRYNSIYGASDTVQAPAIQNVCQYRF